MIGIYKITNLINQKSYIGQSIDITRRWRAHRSSYTIEDNYLYRAMRKYGIENFSFEVIQECSAEELNALEQYYIHFYNTYENGYNLTLGGDSARNSSCPEQILGIIFDLENTNLKQQEIADKWGLGISMVQGINTGIHWHQIGKDYPLRPLSKARKSYCQTCGIEISYGSNYCMPCYRESQKNNRPNREELKQLIRCQTFTSIGEKYNVTDNTIRKWCKTEKLPYRKREISQYSDEEWAKI